MRNRVVIVADSWPTGDAIIALQTEQLLPSRHRLCDDNFLTLERLPGPAYLDRIAFSQVDVLMFDVPRWSEKDCEVRVYRGKHKVDPLGHAARRRECLDSADGTIQRHDVALRLHELVPFVLLDNVIACAPNVPLQRGC